MDKKYKYDLIVKDDIKKSNYFEVIGNMLTDIISGNKNK